MGGIEEVARAAGVSTATVSRALSGRGQVSPSTRERVRRTAARLGYVVSSSASGLATGRTRNVGIVVPALTRWYYSSVVEGAQGALLERGYDLTLYNLQGGGEPRRSVFEDFLLRKRVDAVIAISLELTPDEVTRLFAMKKPIVGVGGPLPGVRTLSVDDVEVSRLITRHLLDLGHRRIAHIGADAEHERDFHVPTNRREGYEAALAEQGISPDPAMWAAGDFTVQGGHAAALRLLADPANRPSAIFAASDQMAIGAILAARELGLDVPRDLSVVGIDDHELAGFFGLTTVAQFPSLQGRMAAEILLDELTAPGAPASDWNTPLPFELIVRTSTAPPAA